MTSCFTHCARTSVERSGLWHCRTPSTCDAFFGRAAAAWTAPTPSRRRVHVPCACHRTRGDRWDCGCSQSAWALGACPPHHHGEVTPGSATTEHVAEAAERRHLTMCMCVHTWRRADEAAAAGGGGHSSASSAAGQHGGVRPHQHDGGSCGGERCARHVAGPAVRRERLRSPSHVSVRMRGRDTVRAHLPLRRLSIIAAAAAALTTMTLAAVAEGAAGNSSIGWCGCLSAIARRCWSARWR
jgi:hypothetical protein